tara:strand:+ start:229 stop:450 length:222 start_codon:yes stop_codon:yes gene_type:complete
MDKAIFKTEIVNGRCPHCNFDVILVSLASDHFRCTTCGTDLEQKINGKISYIPAMSSLEKHNIKLEIKDGQES